MKMTHAFACSLLLVTVAFAKAPPREPRLVGTWRLVEFADLDKDGKWQYWYGEHPRILRLRHHWARPCSDHESSAGWRLFQNRISTPARCPYPSMPAYTTYLAYFGTYTVDAKRHVVTIHVEGSLAPDYTDTDQPRPYKLEGDRLEISDGKTRRRALERVH
jgi:lipocalin-like protein